MILLHLVKKCKTCTFHSQLPGEVKVDGVESSEIINNISKISKTHIRSLIAASEEKLDMNLIHNYL